jgi:hypothetical protein
VSDERDRRACRGRARSVAPGDGSHARQITRSL